MSILVNFYANIDSIGHRKESVAERRNEHHPKMGNGAFYLLLRRKHILGISRIAVFMMQKNDFSIIFFRS